jgi:hypothetical protein
MLIDDQSGTELSCVLFKNAFHMGLERVVQFGRHCLRDLADCKKRILIIQTSNQKEIVERVAALAATLFLTVGLKIDLANICF